MNLDKRLFQYLKATRKEFVLTVLFAGLAAVAVIEQARSLSLLIDGSFLQHKTLSLLLSGLLFFVLITLARFVSQWLSETFAATMATRLKFTIRQQLTEHLNRVSPTLIDLERSGEMSHVVTNGIEALDAYFRSYLPQLFKSALIPILILIFVFPLDLLSGFVFLLTAPVIPVFMILIGQLAKEATQKQWKTLSSMSAFLLDVIEGLTTLKILNRSKALVQRIERVSESFRQATMRVLRIAFLSALVLEMAATISTAIIAVEIGLRLLYAKMAFVDAFFILILAPEFYQPMRLLGSSFHAGMEGFEAAQRMFRLFELPVQGTSVASTGQASSSKALAVKGHFVFRDVRVRYPQSERWALDGVSFELLAGKKNVLIGKSGAGKSTVFNLLLKFLQPESGSILVDGQPLTGIDPQQWYRTVSWVPQKPYLFHDTIEQNILLGNPQASRAQLLEACRKAHLHAFIEQLPQGYDTIIGEQGARLSGGQAQRLALARAFLKDTPIVLLDEPTSNLDPELDAEILEILQDFADDKTQILIAHRLSTVKSADLIIALDAGRVADAGTYRQLTQPGRFLGRLTDSAGGVA